MCCATGRLRRSGIGSLQARRKRRPQDLLASDMGIPVAARAASAGVFAAASIIRTDAPIDYQWINFAIQPRAWRAFISRKEKRRNHWLRRFRVKPLAMTYSCMA